MTSRLTDPFAARFYTRPDNTVDLAKVEEFAALRHAPAGIARRGSSLEQQRASILAIAEREQEHFAASEMVASIDAVDAVIAAQATRPVDDQHRREVILAHHEGRPALLCCRPNIAARGAIRAVAHGDDLADHIARLARADVRPGTSLTFASLLTWHMGRILPDLTPVNRAGAELIEKARWRLADARADRDVSAFQIAAE
jgi:hypothetical protein